MSSTFIKKIECEKCEDSKWNAKHAGLFDDGHTYCFRCETYIASGNHDIPVMQTGKKYFTGEFKAIPERGLSKKTCELLGILEGTYGSKKTCELLGILEGTYGDEHAYAYVYDNGIKIRLDNKDFPWTEGSPNNCSMFGLEQATDFTKPIIITEGEFDTAACYEVGHQACSLKNGKNTAKQSIEKALTTLLKYSEIWLGFDKDTGGEEATEEALKLLPLEKVKLIDWGLYKDANEALIVDRKPDVETHLETILRTSVSEWRPEGIIFANEIEWETIWKEREAGLTLPWPGLQDLIKGFHRGRLYLLGGGAGIGKSSVLRELVYFLRIQYPMLKIAHLFLEEDQEAGPLTYLALHKNISLGELLENKNLIPQAEREALQKQFFDNDRLMFTSEQYELGSEDLLTKLEWLATIKQYDIIILDHISMVAESSPSKESERILINKLMLKLRALVRKTGLIVVAACHLSNPDQGKDWEEGREVRQKDFHGSSALRKVPDVMIGVERNLRDPFNCDELILRVIKNRWFSKVGICEKLIYFNKTGRLLRKEE